MNRLIYTFSLLMVSTVVAMAAVPTAAQIEQEYAAVKSENWVVQYTDPMSYFDPAQWVLDGKEGAVRPTSEGLMLSAGPRLRHDSDHVVLWNRNRQEGDIKIEYDFTRIDNSAEGSVNIIYLHAQGSEVGPYVHDIMEWNHLREIPAMRLYFNNMRLYHISYAVTDYPKGDHQMIDYVRARQYVPDASKGVKGLLNTDLKPEYSDSGLFKVGQSYHITVTLRAERLYMEVKDLKSGERELMWFNIDPANKLTEGYIGLRQMWGRTSRYANFKVSTIE